MKKVLFTLLVGGMFAFSACGPSAENKAAQAKRDSDSVATAQQAAQAAANAQAANDSMNRTAAPADTTKK